MAETLVVVRLLDLLMKHPRKIPYAVGFLIGRANIKDLERLESELRRYIEEDNG